MFTDDRPEQKKNLRELKRETRTDGKRRHIVKPRTVAVHRESKESVKQTRLKVVTEYSDELRIASTERPRTRAECENGPRPCPFVGCRHHLYLDVNPATGSIRLNFPDLEVWEMKDSCALDIADQGGTTLMELGAVINVTRERIRQIEFTALRALERRNEEHRTLRDFAPDQ
jgi:hypothetical protein